MTPMNIWRSQTHIRIDNACLLLAGIDPWEVDPECPTLAMDDKLWGPFASILWAYENNAAEEKQLVKANAWLGRAKQAVVRGELMPSDELGYGLVRVWKRLKEPKEDLIAKDIDGSGHDKCYPVYHEIIAYEEMEGLDLEKICELSPELDFEFDVSRVDLARWLLSMGWQEDELPPFLAGISLSPASVIPTKSEELRSLEALGLLAEVFSKQAPRYQRNGKPNKAQISEAMSTQAGEVSGMSKRKLQQLLSEALEAWYDKSR